MTIGTLGDLLQHLGIADARPTEVRVMEMSKIHDWLRQTWNHATAVAERKVRDEVREETMSALKASVPAPVDKSEVSVADRKSWNRTTKRGGS